MNATNWAAGAVAVGINLVVWGWVLHRIGAF
jgi:hypothetical protein